MRALTYGRNSFGHKHGCIGKFELGSIEAGKIADPAVVFTRNPLDDTKSISIVNLVVTDGRVVCSADHQTDP